MEIICPACNTVYRVPDKKIPKGRTVKATCKKCGRKIAVRTPVKKTADPKPISGTSPQAPSPITAEGRPVSSMGDIQREPAVSARFSYGNAVRFAWNAVKRDPVLTIVGMLIVPVCIQMVFEIFNGLVPEELWSITLVLALTATVMELIVTLGIAGICLKLCDGRPAGFKDLHAYRPLTIKYFLSSLLFAVICLIGFLLLIVPGIILSLWLQFYVFVIVDEKAGPIQALKKSYTVARGNLGRIFGLWCLLVLINIIGMIPCGLGLFVTVPLTFIAWGYLYRSLQGRIPQEI